MNTHWIVRALRPVEALDMVGAVITAEPGQRCWFPIKDAIEAHRSGLVEILSPDGVEALNAAPEAPVSSVQPQAETNHGLQAQTPPPPAPAVAPAAPATPVKRTGPQLLKPLSPKA